MGGDVWVGVGGKWERVLEQGRGKAGEEGAEALPPSHRARTNYEGVLAVGLGLLSVCAVLGTVL